MDRRMLRQRFLERGKLRIRARTLRRAGLAFLLACAFPLSAASVDFVVNSTANTGDALVDGICGTGNVIPDGQGNFVVECTLRAAIVEAEQTAARDSIQFSSDLLYDARGTATISVPSNFQNLDNPVDIDGTTAPTWSSGGYPRVRLLGPGTAGGVDGLRFRTGADGSTVKGIAFQSFQYGVLLDTADDVEVDGCAFGYWVQPPTSTFPPLPLVESLSGNTNGVRVASGASGSKIGMSVTGVGFPVPDFEFAGDGNVFADNEWAIVNHGEDTSIIGNAIGVGIDRSQTETTTSIPAETLGNRWGIWVTNLSGLDIGRIIPDGIIFFQGEGNVISNNDQGIYIDETTAGGGSSASIVANEIGTDGDGLLDRGNTDYGIRVEQSVNDLTIGSIYSAGANIISANGGRGIDVGFASSGAVSITGNTIGLGRDETTPLGNADEGLFAGAGQPLTVTGNLVGNSGEEGIEVSGPWFASLSDALIANNRVGANDAGETHPNDGDGIAVTQNIFAEVEIAGNTVGASQRGIYLADLSREVVVIENYLGTDASGANIGNDNAGLRSQSAEGGHEIGRVGQGNIVGWNGTHGLAVDNGADSSAVVANTVGAMPNGDAIPNEDHGVFVRQSGGAASPVIVGSDLGTNPIDYAGRENVISFNGGRGVSVGPDAWSVIRVNRLMENDQLPIDLGNNGPTANDLGDADLGANGLQNFPELDGSGSFYDDATGELTMEYRVPSFTTESDYDLRIDFYLADPSGTEPMQHVGEDIYPAAEANTQRTVQFFPTAVIPDDAFVVATATDLQARTSEVSGAVFVPEPGFAAGLVMSLLGLGALTGRSTRRGALPAGPRA